MLFVPFIGTVFPHVGRLYLNGANGAIVRLQLPSTVLNFYESSYTTLAQSCPYKTSVNVLHSIIYLRPPTSCSPHVVVQTNAPIAASTTLSHTDVTTPPGVSDTRNGSSLHSTDSNNMYVNCSAPPHSSQHQHPSTFELPSSSRFHYIPHTNPVPSSYNSLIVTLPPSPVPVQQASTMHRQYTRPLRSPLPSSTPSTPVPTLYPCSDSDNMAKSVVYLINVIKSNYEDSKHVVNGLQKGFLAVMTSFLTPSALCLILHRT